MSCRLYLRSFPRRREPSISAKGTGPPLSRGRSERCRLVPSVGCLRGQSGTCINRTRPLNWLCEGMIANARQRHARLQFRSGRDRRHAARQRARLRGRQDRAARRRDRQEQHVSARPLAGARRARRPRHHGRGGMGRLGARLSRALRRDGGNLARLRLGRPVLRRAFQSLRQPDPPQRHRRAEAQISAEAHFRRACRRARDVGARRRLRRGVDEDPRREEGRPLRPQRQQDVDHQRARRPRRWWSMPRPIPMRGRAASRRS